MTQYISLPNGGTASFPDGMSQAAITAELEKQFPVVTAAPSVPAYERIPAEVGSNLLMGLADVAGLPGLGLQAAGIPSPFGSAGWPTPAGLQESLGRLGLANQSWMQPQSETERILAQAGPRGLGSSLPFFAFGPEASLLGRLAGVGTAGYAGGAAGEAAARVAPGIPLVPEAAGELAGLGVGGLSSIFRGYALRRMLGNLSTATTHEEAGDNVQELARQWLTPPEPGVAPEPGSKDAMLEGWWRPVDEQMVGAPVSLNGYHKALGDVVGRGGLLKDQIQLLTPRLPAQLQQDLVSGLGKSPTGVWSAGVAPTGPQWTGTQSVPWEDAAALRTALGDTMTNPKILADIGQQNVKHLYAGLTQDMGNTAMAAGGPEGLDAFTNANRNSSDLYTFVEKHLTPIVKGPVEQAGEPGPGQVSKRLLNGAIADGQRLQALRQYIPQIPNELAAGWLNEDPLIWNRLSGGAKEALFPDPVDRRLVNQTTPVKPSPLRSGTHSLGALVGGEFGHSLATLIGHHLGFPELSSGAAGTMLGLAAPLLWRGTVESIRHPRTLVEPMVGGFGGAANALWPTVAASPPGPP